jgi:ATP-dependent Clp protease ATP-binding subunit ClpA
VNGPTYPRLLKEGQLYLETVKARQGLQKRIQEFQADMVHLESQVSQATQALAQQVKASGITGQEMALVEPLLDRLTGKPQPDASPELQALEAKVTEALPEPVRKLGNLARATTLKRKALAEAERELDAAQQKITALQQELIDHQILPVVGVDEVLQVISEQANVPLNKISEDEEARLLGMKDEIRKRLIGQGPAVEAVVAAIQKNKLGMTKGNRPIGSFLFLGPTGVGKTELAKSVAEYLFGDESAMIRVDMSEYMEEHSVSKMIGSPPGYVGYDDAGQLTERVRKRPYSVVLFDEIEKAHPRVYDLMLQILDDGRLTDSQGRTVDFKNTIVMMTSNKGTAEIMKQFTQIGGDLDPESRRFKHLNANLRKFARKAVAEDSRFRPEFLNRLDEIVTFHPLMQAHIREIIPIQLKQLNADLLNTEARVQVTLDPSGLAHLAEKGTDVMNGARPLKRLMDGIKTAISFGLLNRTILPGDTLTLTADLLSQWEREAEARKHS